MTWPADKRFMTPIQFRNYFAALDFSQWKPIGVVWHNTASPTLKRWHEFSRAHWMGSLENYYKSLGWSGGPHLFIDDGLDGIGIFNPLNKRGVHSPSFNAQYIGIEHVGDYSREDDDVGAGLQVKQNGIMATAVICLKLGIDPLTRIKLHKEDPRTSHDCPGKDMAQDKAKSIQAVLAIMGDDGDHGPNWSKVAVPSAPPSPAPWGDDGGKARVAWLQKSLNSVLPQLTPLVVDGDYGRQTTLRVRQLQTLLGLDVDGLAGPKTAAALDAELAKQKTEPVTKR